MAGKKTLMAPKESWKKVTPGLDPLVARRIEKAITLQRDKPLVRVDFSPSEAAAVLNVANTAR